MRRPLLFAVAAAALLVAVAAIAGVGRPAPASGAAAQAQPSVVTTTGHGSVTAVPDQAVVTAGVDTRAASAATALSENAQAMRKVIAALRGAGGTDVQTQEVSLFPQTDDQGAVTSYLAQNTVSAKARVVDAGGLVDAAVGAGANRVDGPSLDLSDRDALYRDALKQAVADARAKAEALAAAGGFAVGPVFSVSEQGSAPQPVFDAATAARAAAPSTPVEPGTEDVTADVTVSFQIN